MMRTKIYLFSLLALLFTACDHIADDDRLIPVDSKTATDDATQVARNILLEDFTGQRCINCPTGADYIRKMEEAYPDRIIPVGIYWEPQPVANGLALPLGDTYYKYWNIQEQPSGLVNRHGIVKYTDWTAQVAKELQQTSHLSLQVQASLSDRQITITVTSQGIGGSTSGKLQVWVLEDGITAIQLMPDGNINRDYVHNHVLRTAVNGVWGEDFALGDGESKTHTLTQAVDNSWDTSHLSIVAFVYNEAGVEQATKTNVQQQ